MDHLISAKVCRDKLKDSGIFTCTAAYFSQRVSDGIFPTHKKPNSPKDWFKYDEVEAIVKTFSTVAQTKPTKQKEYDDNSLLAQAGKMDSVADMSPEEIKIRLKKESDARDEAKAQAQAAGVDVENPESGEGEGPEVESFLGKSLNHVKIQKEFWLGKKAEVEYKRQMKELVSIEDVNKNAFEVARAVRDSLTGMSARLSAMIAAEGDAHVIRTLIDEEVNRTLASVSETIYE